MARCVLTTSIDHAYMEKMEAEAKRRGLTVSALAREILMAATAVFPPQEGGERGADPRAP